MNPKFLCFSLALLVNFSHAQNLQCTPTLTPEQAFLSIKNPTLLPNQTVIDNSTTANADLPKLININTASEAELTQLHGISAKKAQNIILYREMIAPFSTVDDLDNVKGIGKATIEKNRTKITVR